MTPADIIARLQAHDRDHTEHKEAVHGWLIEAGFHPDVTPCRVVLIGDDVGVWCGEARLSASRAITLHIMRDGPVLASVVSYGGNTTYHADLGYSPVDALKALARSSKVPRALLKGTP